MNICGKCLTKDITKQARYLQCVCRSIHNSQRFYYPVDIRVKRFLAVGGTGGSCKACDVTNRNDFASNDKETPIKILKSMLRIIWPATMPATRVRVLVAFGFLIGAKVANVSVPFFFKYAVDSLTHVVPVDLAATVPNISTDGLARLGSSGLSEYRNALFAKVTQQSVRQIARDVFVHLHNLDLEFHRKRQIGALIKAVDRGTRSIGFVLNAIVFNIVPLLFELGLVCGLLWTEYGISYSSVALSTVCVYSIYTFALTRWRTKFRIDMNRADSDAGNLAVDSLLNFETVKLFNNLQYELDRYDKQLGHFETASLKTQQTLALLNFGQNAIFSCGLTAIMALSASDICTGAITIGDMVAINGLLLQLALPLNFLGTVYREVSQSLVDMHSMFSLMDIKPSVVDSKSAFPLLIDANKSSIVFDNVHFSYEAGQSVLRGVSFEVPSRSKVAFVGSTGAGKTTISRLICRFYDPHSGRILLNGQDIRDVSLESLRNAISVVPQDCVLLHDTILENIRYGRIGATMGEIEAAAKAAQIHTTVMQMPAQFNTMVGERGVKLAGGEKQRIAIARAILKNSQILIYDEATSNLDTITERNIMKALKAMVNDRTSVFIAHRLSTIADANIIYVLCDGRIVEQGSHQSLLASPDSYYRSMWLKQRHE